MPNSVIKAAIQAVEAVNENFTVLQFRQVSLILGVVLVECPTNQFAMTDTKQYVVWTVNAQDPQWPSVHSGDYCVQLNNALKQFQRRVALYEHIEEQETNHA